MLASIRAIGILLGVTIRNKLEIDDRGELGICQKGSKSSSRKRLAPRSLALIVQLKANLLLSSRKIDGNNE